ncbi:MAG: hypothetical protein OXC81_00500 [Betaproteobacteria bacterium]|nr:hypothetical protein [Betaproteobacteria bacterium]
MIGEQISSIGDNWQSVYRQAGLSKIAARLLAQRTFLSPFAFAGLPKGHQGLVRLAEKA